MRVTHRRTHGPDARLVEFPCDDRVPVRSGRGGLSVAPRTLWVECLPEGADGVPRRARELGNPFAHLPDLGCGQAWEAVWKVKPTAPIVCAECRHPMYAKTSRAGMRFFAHAPHAPDCEIAREGESEAHHLLKLELAWAARDAGAHTELEVRAPDGSWRADVLASAPDGSWRIALEAQLSPITDTHIEARTARMRRHGVAACWFSDRPRPPWLGTVPSVRVARAEGGGPLGLAEGVVRFDGRSWRRIGPAALPDFLHWVFHGQAVPHPVNPESGYAYEHGLRRLPVVWTHPMYSRLSTF